MSIRKDCPCDIDGICPYDATYFNTCEFYCSCDDENEFDYYDDESGV